MTDTAAARHCGAWDQDICSTVALLESSHASFYFALTEVREIDSLYVPPTTLSCWS